MNPTTKTVDEEVINDVVIIGGGTGGYVAAIRVAQLGLRVVLIEADKLGGTCLHRGCIPSKAYLRSAEMLHHVKQAHQFGIEINQPVLNWSQVIERKDALIQLLHQGVQGLVRKNKIELIYGRGFVGSTVEDGENTYFVIQVQDKTIRGKRVILATGSRPNTLGLQVDDSQIMTSDQALLRQTLPRSVIIVGGGIIGMEWASLYNDCGVEVTVIESQPRILMTEDEAVAKEAFRLFTKRGIHFHTGASVKVDEISKSAECVRIPLQQQEGGPALILEAEAVLLSVGRLPNVENVYAESFQFVRKGQFLQVSDFQETNIAGIYAIGDVCGGGLAHTATLQAVIAVEQIAGLSPEPYNPLLIPKCTYSRPEIASVGYHEEAARLAGYELNIGKFPFRAVGKALVQGEFEGFAKIITDASNNKILGVHLIGPHATELIAESGVIVANGMNLSQWLKSTHAHPTLSEVYHEALAVLVQA